MFSVIIPLYNKEATVQRAIYSVLTQHFQNFELIIVDDGSTDQSAEYAKIVKDERIRIVTQSNAGGAAARNKGIGLANQSYVAFLDADDEWLPHHLSTVAALIRDHRAGLYATGFRFVDSQGRSRACNNFDRRPLLRGLFNYLAWIGSGREVPFGSLSVVANKNVIKTCGLFKEGCEIGPDVEMWVRMQVLGGVAFDSTVTSLYHYETPGNTVTATGPNYDFPGYFLNPQCDWILAALAQSQIPSHLISDAQSYVDRFLLKRVRDCLDRSDGASAQAFLYRASGHHQMGRLKIYRLLANLPRPVLKMLNRSWHQARQMLRRS